MSTHTGREEERQSSAYTWQRAAPRVAFPRCTRRGYRTSRFTPGRSAYSTPTHGCPTGKVNPGPHIQLDPDRPLLLTRSDVADYLNIPLRTLTWWFYALRPQRRYGKFEVNRRDGGPRTIMAP